MISDLAKRQKNDLIRDITSLGSLFFYVLIMALFLLLGNNPIFLRLLTGLITLYFVTVLFRTFLFKNRPKKIKYESYIEKLDAGSFPSLHASRTVFLALVFAYLFNNLLASALLALLVLIISYSRIRLKKHDFKDVLGGIILGILAYYIIQIIL